MNIKRETIFSPCKKYRYTLWRDWSTSLDFFEGCNDGERGVDAFVNFIMLNPSTADEKQNDPTIRRCIGFAQRWGFGALCVTNLFAWRDTHPEYLKIEKEPVGADNDDWIINIARESSLCVAAWGNHGTHMEREKHVREKLLHDIEVKCLGYTNDGCPKHPVRIAYACELEPL